MFEEADKLEKEMENDFFVETDLFAASLLNPNSLQDLKAIREFTVDNKSSNKMINPLP